MSTYTEQWNSLLEEAQHWDRALKSGGSAERAAFAAWIKRSPQHLQAYLQILALETEMKGLDTSDTFDLGTRLARTSDNVVQFTSLNARARPMTLPPSSERRKRLRRFAATALGAFAAATLLVGSLLTSLPHSTDYTTGTGEQRRIVLADGSTIELNTQSHVRVSFRQRSREVDLLTGEALFNVHHDSTRPFRVHVRDKIIEDLGTQFSIYLRPDASTTVSVLSGLVQISSDAPRPHLPAVKRTESTSPEEEWKLSAKPKQLSAGNEVRIAATGKLIKHVSIDVTEAAPWRKHQLWFEGASLPEVAAEFNRYNTRQLRIGSSPTLLAKRYTAIFDANDPDSFVQALRDDPTLIVRPTDEGLLIDLR